MNIGGGGERKGGGGVTMLALVQCLNLLAGTPLLAGWAAGGRQAPTLAGWNFCLLPLVPGLPPASGVFIAGVVKQPRVWCKLGPCLSSAAGVFNAGSDNLGPGLEVFPILVEHPHQQGVALIYVVPILRIHVEVDN